MSRATAGGSAAKPSAQRQPQRGGFVMGLVAGLLIGLATVVSGPLYDAYGVGGYLAMTALAGAGLMLGLTIRNRIPDVA